MDPSSFERGEIARQTAVYDSVVEEVRPMALVLQQLLCDLQQPDRTAVELVSMQGLSLYEAAEIMEVELGYLADSKTVWRWCKRGERRLRSMMRSSGFYKEDEDADGRGFLFEPAPGDGA